MRPRVLLEYRRLRAKGWTASAAMRAARVYVAFNDAEADGLVRLRCEEEAESWSSFEPNWEGLYPRECDRKRARAAWLEHTNRDGVWAYFTDYRASADDPWEQADSIGGVVGDIRDTGYDTDLKESALKALDDARQEAANALSMRPTYAAGAPA